MASEEMLRKLLDEFVEREALIHEELGVIQDQIQQLEERLTGCRGRLSTIGSDREKILSIRMRYEDGQFLSDMNFGEATNPQIFTTVSAPAPYVHAPNTSGHTVQSPSTPAASAIAGPTNTQAPALNGVEQPVAPLAPETSYATADLAPPENHSTAHPEPAVESSPPAESFRSIAHYLNNVVAETSSPASVPAPSNSPNPAVADPFSYSNDAESSSGRNLNAQAATDNFSQYMSQSMFDESNSEVPQEAPLPASAVVPPAVPIPVSEGNIGSGRAEIRLSSTPNSPLPGINALLGSRNPSAVPPVPSNAQQSANAVPALNPSDSATTQPESGVGTDNVATNAPAASADDVTENKASIIDLGANEAEGEDPDGGETVKSINDALRSLFR